MTTQLPQKAVPETPVLSFDFSCEATSVTFVSITVTVDNSVNGDATPANILLGVPEVDSGNAAILLQQVQNGDPTTDYHIAVVATNEDGVALMRDCILPVRPYP